MMIRAAFIVLVLSVLGVSAQVTFSNALGNNMVLQRAPAQARVWGTCPGKCAVNVIFSGQTITASVSVSTGSSPTTSWNALLPPTPAGGPYNINATDDSGNSVSLSNVLFGDVYICSGQSNMEMVVSQCFNATENIPKADHFPNIRLFTVGQGTTSSTPLSQFKTIEQKWVQASAASISGGDYSVFSGTCWYFATNLYYALQVPIGLVSSNWGGTTIQQWSSPSVLSTCNSPASGNDGQLWNAMIYPLLPMSIKGALWYQGESNVGQTALYACLFPAMIADWRTNFQNPNFGFYFVQLAAYTRSPGDVALAQLRESQEAALALTNVGMATAVDLGDINSPYGNIHPQDKETVGYRLHLQALSLNYGQKIQADGPMIASVTANPTIDYGGGLYAASCVVAFTSESAGNFFKEVDNVCPPGAAGYCGWVEIQSDDGSSGWVAATDANIGDDGKSLIISYETSSPTATITGVRYGYADWPVCTFYNDANLPVIPFIWVSQQ